MKQELTKSAKIAEDAIVEVEMNIDRDHTIEVWFVLAYAALRILANIADKTAELSEVVDHHSGCIVTRPVEY